MRTNLVAFLCVIFMGFSAAPLAAATAKPGKPSSLPSEMKKKEAVEWKQILEAAKKEGKIVISGDPSEAWRASLVDLFQQEYPEITVEYTGTNGRDFTPRLKRERELGQKLWDLAMRGTTSGMELKRGGFLDPIRALLLPEIADDSKWIGGLDSLFYDRENKYVPAFTMYIQRTTSVNHDFIKESELKSSRQLIDPKYRGKIVIQPPTSGATFSALCNLAHMYGAEFVRELLTKQDLVVTNDKRQQAEWVVRGKYPIAIGFTETQLVAFLKQGLGKNVSTLEDKLTPVATGTGGVFLIKDAPHPNAAAVYVNWLLSQKTQMRLTKNVMLNSLRTDVPPVDKGTAVDPAHLSNYYRYSTEESMEASERFLPVINEFLKK